MWNRAEIQWYRQVLAFLGMVTAIKIKFVWKDSEARTLENAVQVKKFHETKNDVSE